MVSGYRRGLQRKRDEDLRQKIRKKLLGSRQKVLGQHAILNVLIGH